MCYGICNSWIWIALASACILAVGNFESDENPKNGGGLNPNGGSQGIPVAKDKMFSSCNMKVDPLQEPLQTLIL